MMKGIGFTFDAFSQWSEYDRSKMKWRLKVKIEWIPSMADRPPSPSFAPFPSTISLFSLTTTPLGQNEGALARWAGRPTTILGRPSTPWLPYERVAKGSLLLHPTSSQATSNFLNASPSS
jgi:hypothetical protein